MAPSTPATIAPGVETATSIPQAWVNSHSLLISLMRATTLGTSNASGTIRSRVGFRSSAVAKASNLYTFAASTLTGTGVSNLAGIDYGQAIYISITSQKGTSTDGATLEGIEIIPRKHA